MPIHQAESSSRPAWAEPFHPLVAHGDLQTILARYWPTDRAPLSNAETRLIETDEETRVLAKVSHRGADRTLLVVHGLSGCDEARYMLTVARRALERGFNVVRLNVRNCGASEHLTPTLYHSGLTSDLRRVVEALPAERLFILGFSMGGNMALKLAGEWGARPPAKVRGVCAVSAPIDLAACSRAIGRRRNRIYELRFLRNLKAAVRRKRALMPERFPEPDFRGVDGIWEFDDRFTAPAFGFRDAADYYERSSAKGYLDAIRVPTLLIQAEDDPFVPFSTYGRRAFESNPAVALLASRRGGHVAFLARGPRRFWAEEQALNFFEDAASRAAPAAESEAARFGKMKALAADDDET